MQQLVFHPKWDKAIAEQDRQEIIHTFSNVTFTNDDPIQMTVMKQALNHKGELLVTGIVHNLTEGDYSPNGEEVVYKQARTLLAKNSFSISDLIIKGKTSTPWTFIFPKETIVQEPDIGVLGTIDIAAK